MNTTSKKYFGEIDIVKGIAILTVIWHHSMIKYPINMLDLPWCKYAMDINNTYFLVVFFFVSGYLFANSRPKPFLKTLGDKANRLLVPYFSFELINILMKLIAPELVNRKIESVWVYIEKVLLYGGELWFVYCLFLIFVVWPNILQRVTKPVMCSILLFLCLLNMIFPEGIMGGIFLNYKFIFYSIFFIAGYLIKDIDRNLLQDKHLFLLVCILFIVFCVLFVNTIKIPLIDRYFKCTIGCAFVWMLSFKLLNYKRVSQPLTFVGRYSLPYYWLNGFALVFARVIVVNIFHVSYSPAIAISIFVICVFIETIGILAIRRLPYVRKMIGIR